MTGVDTDLATLRETVWEIAGCGDIRFSPTISSAEAEHEAALARVEAELSRLREERDAYVRAMDTWEAREQKQHERAEAAEARCAELQGRVYALETSLPENYMETLRDTEARCARLQQALGAYRSALRSGEPESEQLRQMGDEALAGPGGQDPVTGSEAAQDTPADSPTLREYVCAHDHRWFMQPAFAPNGCPMCNTISFRLVQPADSQEDKT